MADLKLATMIATGSLLAAGAGLGAAVALGQEGEPTKTVTIDVGTGETGPPGPAGPPGPKGEAGPAGGTTCPTGFAPAVVVFNAPGGQQSLYTCLKG